MEGFRAGPNTENTLRYLSALAQECKSELFHFVRSLETTRCYLSVLTRKCENAFSHFAHSLESKPTTTGKTVSQAVLLTQDLACYFEKIATT
ncbi:MAG: hypothetical protein ACI9VM_000837 [Candidatus Azotimanducaceae bacterium]|jgi:hypothetical protein